MHSSTILSALLPAAAVMAQYGSGSDSASSTSASAAAASSIAGVHVVKVGDGGLTFEPNSVKAAVGDIVEFHFYPRAHSVAQSAFDSPCQPLSNGTTTGFFSGPVQVASGVGSEVFTVEVKDTNPKWFYCATGQHCQGGMVGVINAPSNGQRTIEQYAQAAAAAQANVAPSATGGGSLGSAATGSPSSASGAPSASSSTQPSAGIEARGDVRWGLLSLGMAAAGVVGGLLI
ncbi:extracellular serine-rich protein [Colletotrichum tofieldiae]|uniref:Extracellular serine-rich protein n=1 Tax=Colletotrichum tofieldiae TaxID=708197 RepID=A0A166YPY9_9PEZI|nr:extracellular serine-rich protein [Colletotrichum tofieldiae]GKT59630.1 extracellular serine-rich protein [Colletotrichum tofieldiae]GKT78429.1 extracellular serine-rich protein [Colletotrichum tofieldiae]